MKQSLSRTLAGVTAVTPAPVRSAVTSSVCPLAARAHDAIASTVPQGDHVHVPGSLLGRAAARAWQTLGAPTVDGATMSPSDAVDALGVLTDPSWVRPGFNHELETVQAILTRPDAPDIQRQLEDTTQLGLRRQLVRRFGAKVAGELCKDLDKTWDARPNGRMELYIDKAIREFPSFGVADDRELGTTAVDVGGGPEAVFAGADYFHKGLMPLLDQAKDHVHISNNEYEFGHFGSAIADKLIELHRDRGVKVRFMICSSGSNQTPGTRDFESVERMKAAGIEVLRVNPIEREGLTPKFHIMHSKYFAVDSKAFMTGGGTIVDKSFASADRERELSRREPVGRPPSPRVDDVPRTRDMLLRYGPGQAAALQESVFLRQWQRFGGELEQDSQANLRERYFPDCTSDAGSEVRMYNTAPGCANQGHGALVDLIDGAEKSITLTAAYISLDEVVAALQRAVEGGKTVRVMIPKLRPRTMDQFIDRVFRSQLGNLAAHPNFELREYTGDREGDEQGYIHSKYAVSDLGADHAKAWVSSGNPEQFISGWTGGGRCFDISSTFDLHADGQLAAQFAAMIADDYSSARSEVVDPKSLTDRSWGDWAVDSLCWLGGRAGFTGDCPSP